MHSTVKVRDLQWQDPNLRGQSRREGGRDHTGIHCVKRPIAGEKTTMAPVASTVNSNPVSQISAGLMASMTAVAIPRDTGANVGLPR